MKTSHIDMMRRMAGSAVFSLLLLPAISFAITDSTNFTSRASGYVTLTPSNNTRPVSMTITTYGNTASPYNGTNTAQLTVPLNSSRNCSYTYDSGFYGYTNGSAKSFAGLTQDVSNSTVKVDTIGLVWLHLNPSTGSSSDWIIGMKKGSGPLIEGSGLVNSFLRPLLNLVTSGLGMSNWDYSFNSTQAPAQYQPQCGYTSPVLTWNQAQ